MTGRPVPADVPDMIRRSLLRMIDIELSLIPDHSLYFDGPKPAPQVSPGCYEASFGWVHVRPACRCSW
jgi:hypothetical protein